MKNTLLIVIGLHGIIHLFGFLKAFGIAEFNAISEPISEPFGIVWLLVFVLFLATFILILFHYDYWWVVGLLSVLLSQFLIISFWKDAKFGTILNLVILISVLVAYSSLNFRKKIISETKQMRSKITMPKEQIISEQRISNLPSVVRKYLLNSGVVNKEPVFAVYLEQDLQMLLKPDQKEWTNAQAKQYFTINPPAFNWSVKLKMNPLINVVGRDKFERGKGEMMIKVFSIIPVVNAKNNEKISQASLQRYLAEIVWFPSAALSQYIKWEHIDDRSAKATMTYNGTSGSGIFHFDDEGNFKQFVAMRFRNTEDTQPTEWTVSATETQIMNGIKIPVEAKASWKLKDGDWTWLKLRIEHIEYNVRS